MEDQAAVGALFAIMSSLIFMLIMLAFVVFGIFIWWKIFAKTGQSGALSLLMLIPVVNFIMILILAFSEWPVEKELKLLKSSSGSGNGYTGATTSSQDTVETQPSL